LGLGLGLILDLVYGWVSCYAHVFVLLSAVIVTLSFMLTSFVTAVLCCYAFVDYRVANGHIHISLPLISSDHF